MSNAILIMSDNHILTKSFSHQDRVTVHWIIQVFAVVLITIAQICIFWNKVRLEKSHYQTTHAIFGLITYILTLLTTFGGKLEEFYCSLINEIIFFFRNFHEIQCPVEGCCQANSFESITFIFWNCNIHFGDCHNYLGLQQNVARRG
jgi:uncharacterized protein YqgC (DUF456 family)